MSTDSSTAEVEVVVEPEYLEARSSPENNVYVFAYRVRITNQGKRSMRLISRHWIITDDQGHTEEVRGMGVVGAQPHLGPGDSFSYMSFCPLNTPVGTMAGSYQMVTDQGEEFEAPIPEFSLIIPSLVN